MLSSADVVRLRKSASITIGGILAVFIIIMTLEFGVLWSRFVGSIPLRWSFITLIVWIVFEILVTQMAFEWTIYLLYRKGVIASLRRHCPHEFRFLSTPYLTSDPLRNALEVTFLVAFFQFVVLGIASTL